MSGQRLIATVAAAILTSGVVAQSRQVPAPPQRSPIVIHGATVHPVSGPVIGSGYVAFNDGRITRIGEGEPPSIRGAERVDGRGLHVYPGLIAPFTNLGLTEVGSVRDTQDYSEHGRFKPEVRASIAINPDSDLIPVARANGILTAMVRPSGGLVSGRGVVVRLDGWSWEDLAVRDNAALIVSWPRTEPIDAWWMEKSREEQLEDIAADLRNIERRFDDAAAYLKAVDADPAHPVDLRFEAMRPFLKGVRPLMVQASSMGQIEAAVAWAERRGLRIVIVGGHEADRVLPLLRKHDVPVIVGGIHRLPGRRHDGYDQPFSLPARLADAGIRFCIGTGGGAAHLRNLNHMAATAAAYGLDRDAALRAVTLSTAELLGIGDTHGSLDVGKAATLTVTTGDPLEITTDVLIAYIDGRRIDLGNRQKTLYEKYRRKYVQLGLLDE